MCEGGVGDNGIRSASYDENRLLGRNLCRERTGAQPLVGFGFIECSQREFGAETLCEQVKRSGAENTREDLWTRVAPIYGCLCYLTLHWPMPHAVTTQPTSWAATTGFPPFSASSLAVQVVMLLPDSLDKTQHLLGPLGNVSEYSGVYDRKRMGFIVLLSLATCR